MLDLDKMKILLIVVLLFVITLIGISSNSIFAQNSNSNSNYLYYQDSLVGMSINYPSDWVYNEHGMGFRFSDDIDTRFIPSSEISFDQSNTTESDRPLTYVSIGKKLDLPYKNMPLDLIYEYMKKLRTDNGDNITDTGKIKLYGFPAYEIDFTSNDTRKTVLVISNIDAESYFFEYSALPDKFNTYLPIAQEMFKTLAIIGR